jgi:hypothetical protein
MIKRSHICGPHAVAALSGARLVEAVEHVRRVGDYGPRWNGRSNINELVIALARLGWRSKVAKGRGSLASWVDQHTRASGRYLVRVGNHFVAVVERKVCDQHTGGFKPIGETNLGRKRVTHAFEVSRLQSQIDTMGH